MNNNAIQIINDEIYKTSYKREVSKKDIPVCDILGVQIAAINMTWLVKYLLTNLEGLSGDYLCVSNVHTTVLAFHDEKYRKVQNGGIMAIPDGGPLSSLGRRRGYSSMERTTGPELMQEIFELSDKEKNYRHYFYGSTPQTLEKLESELKRRYPNLKIAGMYSPPFRKLTQEEDIEVVERINKTKPDFVWIGLGAPKQEIWMAKHQGLVKGLMLGVGAGFDYHAGNRKRAPQWMQRMNLEWLYRLLQDPKRLFKRYLCTNTSFIWNAVIRGR